MIVAVTIGGKVDTAETGVGGEFELSTVAALDKIDPPFPYVVVIRTLKYANSAVALHTGIQERCMSNLEET